MKQYLHDMINAIVDGNVESAEKAFSSYVSGTTRKVVESRYDTVDYGYDDDDDVNYDPNDGLEEYPTDFDEKITVTVDGHAVEIKVVGKQMERGYGEDASFDSPGDWTVSEYGPVEISTLNLSLDGKWITEFDCDVVEPTPEGIFNILNDINTVPASNDHDLSEEESKILTPDFLQKVAKELATKLAAFERKEY